MGAGTEAEEGKPLFWIVRFEAGTDDGKERSALKVVVAISLPSCIKLKKITCRPGF